MADKSNRLYRDPDRDTVSKWCDPSPKDGRDGYWTRYSRETQDERFRLAMSAAVEAGLETCATEPSTRPGTKCPVANYTRD